MASSSASGNAKMTKKRSRDPIWRDEETKALIQIWKEPDILAMIAEKMTR